MEGRLGKHSNSNPCLSTAEFVETSNGRYFFVHEEKVPSPGLLYRLCSREFQKPKPPISARTRPRTLPLCPRRLPTFSLVYVE